MSVPATVVPAKLAYTVTVAGLNGTAIADVVTRKSADWAPDGICTGDAGKLMKPGSSSLKRVTLETAVLGTGASSEIVPVALPYTKDPVRTLSGTNLRAAGVGSGKKLSCAGL
jgi:hypothetical protein